MTLLVFGSTAIIGLVVACEYRSRREGERESPPSEPEEPRLTRTRSTMKMAAGSLLLVCAVVLCSVRAQDAYDQLPDDYKKGVDLALELLETHAGVNHRYRFLRSLEKSDTEVDLEFCVTSFGLTGLRRASCACSVSAETFTGAGVRSKCSPEGPQEGM